MKYLLLLSGLAIALSACSRNIISTGQDFTIDLVGAEKAYCVVSTFDNRYTINAPGTTLIERDRLDLTVDCQDNMSDRRRVMAIESHFGLGFWSYPEVVKVDFGQLENGDLKNGYRAENGELTEKSFSRPLVPVFEPDDMVIENNVFETMMTEEIMVNEQTPQELVPLSFEPSFEDVLEAEIDSGRRSYPIPLD